nr:aldehyde dehydrogenase family protein [Actinomycetota bacterium]
PYTMPAEAIAPALASGNAVVWTPASSTSICSVKLAECIADAGVPAGVFNMITGPGSVVGDEVAANPGTQAIAFIGSVGTGQRVAERAAGKALLLEMGGNGPMVVLDDADLDAAADASLTSAFLCAGQSCTAGERFLVQEGVYDAFLERLQVGMEREIQLGDPFAPETTLGPLNNEPTAQKMDRHVSDALERGAELIAGGARAEGFPTRLYYQPTVLGHVTEEMEVAQEETFGPIVPVTAIRDDAEALRAVNSSSYGLLCAVWTRDMARGLRFAESVRTGWVNVNASSNHWESHLPFGGRAGSQSGVGRVGGRYPMETFTELKTVIVSVE